MASLNVSLRNDQSGAGGLRHTCARERFFRSIPSGVCVRMTDRWILPEYPFGGLRQNDRLRAKDFLLDIMNILDIIC